MYYGDDIVDEVRSRNDIVDLIGSYVTLKKSGSNFMGLCPFHNEKTPSFSVSRSKQIFYCFGCGKGGDVYTFLRDYENLTFIESVKLLAERAGVVLPEDDGSTGDNKKRELKETIFEINAIAAKFYHAYLRDERGKIGLDYLKNRGVSDDMIKAFGLGYAGVGNGNLYRYIKSKGYSDEVMKETGLFSYDNKGAPYDKFWNRVMFPIVDRRNHIIGFGGRVMGDAKPKYLNSPETIVFDKSRNLYGINYVHGKLPDGLILCEGYMDVIALHQAGFNNAVAALGTSFTEGHSHLIKRMTDKVYICFDSDDAGKRAAMRAIPMFKSAGIRTRVIDMSPHKDPDEFIKNNSADAFRDRIEHAKISFFFEIGYMQRDYDMDDPEQKTRFMNEAAAKILTFEDEIERNNYIDAFAREYHIRSEDFRSLVAKQSAKRAGIDYDKRRAERSERKKPAEDAIAKSQGILLTFLSDNPNRLNDIKKYISVDDFVDDPYKSVAKKVFSQIEADGRVDAAGIVGGYSDSDEQAMVAGIFHKDAGDGSTQEKALRDVVYNIMQHSIDYRSANVTDVGQMKQIIEDKKRLEHISIDL